jgi:hypothetical protein
MGVLAELLKYSKAIAAAEADRRRRGEIKRGNQTGQL